MLAQVHSYVLQGIDPLPCEVEVDVAEVALIKTTVVGQTHRGGIQKRRNPTNDNELD